MPKPGDFYADMNFDVACWVPSHSLSPVIKNGFGIRPGEKVTTLFPLIWLPKLDQLMELSQMHGACFREISFSFYEWVKIPYGDYGKPAGKFFPTLEQVWLAFLMNRKFGKSWRDDDWNKWSEPDLA